MEKKLVCIVCPVGCRLTVTGEAGDLTVSGQSCKKGVAYALEEISNPVRMVCTTVKISGGVHKVIPVRTDRAIPDKYKLEVVKAVRGIELKSPVYAGDIVVADLFGTGVNLVAERDM